MFSPIISYKATLPLWYCHVGVSSPHMGPRISLAIGITWQFVPPEDVVMGLHEWFDFKFDSHKGWYPLFYYRIVNWEYDLGSRARIKVGGRLVRGSGQYIQIGQPSVHKDMDPQYATIDQLAEITDTMASLRDAILGLGQRIDRH